MEFYQRPPELKNTFSNDPLLAKHLQQNLPKNIYIEIAPHLQTCGDLAITQWLEWSRDAEAHPPQHIPFAAWGERIDEIQLSHGWKNLEAEAARHGIVACAYERKHGEYARMYQFALLYLFHSSSAFVSCPLAMTDGAARAIELYGDEYLKTKVLPHLLSRDSATFWTSGQWMTEKTGGSDVSGTSTIAREQKGRWLLSGMKWFTSATTSPVSLLLARPEGAEAGSRGLSLFCCELRGGDGKLQGLRIERLKSKLGTKALPTAELTLQETPARLVGDLGNGVKKISSLFNVTRVYNSICATSHMRRALDYAHSYSQARVAFGKPLYQHPLHQHTLQKLEEKFKTCFYLTAYIAHLLGKEECETATELEARLLRALTPITKMYTAKMCTHVVSEVVEIFGGAGYCEDTGIPVLLRDAQVFSIWEGTTNVLCLDFLRAVEKENVLPALTETIQKQIAPKANPVDLARIQQLITLLQQLPKQPREQVEIQSRDICFLIAEIFGAGYVS